MPQKLEKNFVKKDLPSILRNPKIAKILYYNKKIENGDLVLKEFMMNAKSIILK